MAMLKQRLVVVSNRVPPALGHGEFTPGGLVSALLPTLEQLERPLWVGWSGQSGSSCTPIAHDERTGISFVRLDLSEAEIEEYYQGFCNQVLWPLLHGIPERAGIDRDCSSLATVTETYFAVNRRVADTLMEVLAPGDLVWIHDYHLIPLAQELRRRGWRDPVGYFHHVPIPTAELWARMPEADALARSFAAYDRVGVQTEADAERLRAIVPEAASRIAAYPISIDPEAFRTAIDDAACDLPDDDGRMLFFGVDRLDYTKAIPQRLEGFERALEAEPRMRTEARFVQWASPSREAIPEYQAERQAVETIAARVGSRYEPSPLQVEFEPQPPQAVGAALRRADVCVVTSIADGMNLVAKEFAAVHSWDRPGVLVLSDSCGAAAELTDALIFPAGDTDALSEALRQAFLMPLDERRQRAQRLREIVDGHTCIDWATSFIADLAGAASPPRGLSLTSMSEISVPAAGLRDAVERRLEELERDETVPRIWERDHTVWKPNPDEISNRLGWLDIDVHMRGQLGELRAFADEARAGGFTTVLLLGMGGSSLAPRVLAESGGSRDQGLELVVLSTTVPDEIRAVERRLDPARTLFVVSSKSGTTVETRALLDYFWERVPRGDQYIAITDAGTPLAELANERSFRRVFLNPSDLGGRYSALSYFGLVPAALTGFDLERLLDGASSMREACMNAHELSQNPGAHLGALLGEAALRGRDYLLIPTDTGVEPFAAWLEQLIAESTGKEMTGILPVLGDPRALELPEAPGSRHMLLPMYQPGSEDLSDPFRIGAAFFRWEFAVAVIGHILSINPFDQPDVESAKRAASDLLGGQASAPPALSPREVLADIEPDQYVALQAYLPRSGEIDRRLHRLRVRVQERTQVPTVIEYGPSLLHSTGQYHKGGPGRGAFIQLLEPSEADLAIPERDYTFEELKNAQAAGDRLALHRRECPVGLGTLGDLEALF